MPWCQSSVLYSQQETHSNRFCHGQQDMCWGRWGAWRWARTSLIVTRVLDEVVLEHTHEDGGQEARQQQHRHTAVDYGEPMDLHPPTHASLTGALFP